MRGKRFQYFFLVLIVYLLPLSCFQHGRSAALSKNIAHHSRTALCARRKRRTTVQGNEKKTSLDVPAEMKVTEANLNITAIRDTVKGQIVNSRLAPKDSKLPPMSGTSLEAQAKYKDKGFIQNAYDEYFAPTAAGQEPKLVKAAKTVTWVSVLLLVIVEIVVSVKVGGLPFEFGKVSLPTLPNIPGLFNGNGN